MEKGSLHDFLFVQFKIPGNLINFISISRSDTQTRCCRLAAEDRSAVINNECRCDTFFLTLSLEGK